MAFTSIKNGVVAKAFNGGRGYVVEERFKKQNGEDGRTAWKVWFDEPTTLTEGQKVSVSGLHSDKVNEFEGREGDTVRIVERTINSARLSDDQPEPVDAVDSEPF